MNVNVKNSKSIGPMSMITQVVDADTVIDDLGNHPIVAYVYHRRTSTPRRAHAGGNVWDLYYVEAQPGYVARREYDMACGRIHLGRRDGRDIDVCIRRIAAPEIELPNGETLPAETAPLPVAVRLRYDYPADPEHVQRIYDLLPFTDPRTGEPEPVYAEDAFMREWVSRWAVDFPHEYRDILATPREGVAYPLRIDELYDRCRTYHEDAEPAEELATA